MVRLNAKRASANVIFAITTFAAVLFAFGYISLASAKEDMPDAGLRAIDGFHRIQLLAGVGEIAYTRLQADGRRLFIAMSERAESDAWREHVIKINQLGPPFAAANLHWLNHEPFLVVDLDRPLVVVDETLAMSALNQVSWEMVFAERGHRAGGQADIPPELLAIQRDVSRAMFQWAEYWSRQDVEGYLSSYSDSFEPDGGMTLSQWRSQRRDRLTRPSRISVVLSDMHVDVLGEGHARVRASQSYEANHFSSVTHKEFYLRRDGERWLITSERAARDLGDDSERLEAKMRGPLLELTLMSRHDMVADVSLAHEPDRLFVELRGVDPGAMLSNLSPAWPELMKRPSVESLPGGRQRLVFEAKGPIELVEAYSSFDTATEQNRIHLLMVPDSEVNPALVTRQLGRFEISAAGPGLSLILDSPADMPINSYFLPEPGRLMVDFPGLPIEAIEEAVFAFRTDGVYVAQIRYGETRLGSARLELTLNEAYAASLDPTTVPFRERYEHGVLIAMPETGRILSTDTHPVELADVGSFDRATLRHLPRFDFTTRPVLTIGSVTLSSELHGDPEALPAIAAGDRFSLLGALAVAMELDPDFQAAEAEFRAIQEQVPQARAGYLPAVNFEYQYSAAHQRVHASGSIPTGSYHTPSQQWSVTLTQPIYRLANLVQMSQAELLVEQGRLGLLAAEQDLILRLATAYLAVLAAQDGVDLARAEYEAVSAQFELAERRFRSGLGSRGEESEARSRAAITRARMIEAENALDDARLALKEIVGIEVDSLHTFHADFRAVPPFPAVIAPWLDAAINHNLPLQIQRLATQVAALEIRRQRAGHRPTVDLVASVGQQSADSTLYSDRRQDVASAEVGIRVSVPLYTGGRASSLVREAAARKDQAHQREESEQRRTERLVRSAHQGVSSSAEMLAALREGVVAQEVRLATRLRGYETGIESQVAVLDAYQNYYAARRAFLQARYDYLINRLSIKQAVGSLSRHDLAEFDGLLEQR